MRLFRELVGYLGWKEEVCFENLVVVGYYFEKKKGEECCYFEAVQCRKKKDHC